MYLTATTVLLAFCALLCLGLWRYTAVSQNASPYPPGPPPHFLWGNLFDIPHEKAYLTYAKWAKTYGDVIHLQALGQHILVLNTQEKSEDLLEKRSQIYSDRAQQTILTGTGWSEWNETLMPYNDHWKSLRKLGQHYLKSEQMSQYHPVHIARVEELLRNLIETPQDFLHHVRTQSTGSIMSITYGYNVSSHGDPFVDLAENAILSFSQALLWGRNNLLTSLPLMHHLPSWMPLQKHLAKTRDLAMRFRFMPFEYAQKAWEAGRASSCIVEELLSEHEEEGMKNKSIHRDIRDLAASLYAGGADTTPSSAATFFVAMACNPHIQKQAQAQVDEVVGNSRLPDFSDRLSLPYVEAVMREVLRWRPIVPMSVPHLTMAHDVYEGYFIPKGTIVMSNIWAINNDEQRYSDPSKFEPSRHFNSDGTLKDDPSSESPVFGHGRRKCPGRYMADATLWITIANLLATFHIALAKDENGKEIPIENTDYPDGVVYHPTPFPCSITPRTAEAEALIRATHS